ncbi:putative RNA-binding protein YlmH [Clostridia bacterium]|nr:putative RNA-binding protein YlmH [Clostridia bacterium]
MDSGEFHSGSSDPVQRRLSELAQRAETRGEAVYSRFLDPAQQALAIQTAQKCGVAVEFWGGYDDAERRIGVFHPIGMECGSDWPIACVRITWAAAYGSPAHRDLLGSSLAVVQDRSRFGDIVVGGGFALMFCAEELADHVVISLTQAGRVTVHCAIEPDPASALPDQTEDRREVRDTIPSFRLDAGIASAFKLSRAQAQELIREGRVRRNHLPALDSDAQIKEGDMLSVRGLGHAELSETLGMNRKGRFGVKWICTEVLAKGRRHKWR